MNKKKLIASVLTVALLVGAVGASVYAVETNKPAGGENEASTDVEEILSQVSEEAKATGKDLTKEETVYVIADASGQANKVIVSDWIQNGTQNAEIKDETDLEDIKNVKGNESYKMNEEGMCVWDAKGHDIYYQGTTNKALPVDVRVSYKLDGEPISADDIAGKSGKVTIRFDYINNESKMMNVAGKQEKIYVPFAMLTGTIMDHEVFSNIEVTNGKIINEGEKTIVTGLAFPGLSDDLGVKADSDVEIPAYFEITADAKNFSMKNTVTIATNTIFEDFDTDKFDSASLKDGMNQLNDGMDKLIDGTSELYDGMEKLLDGSHELATGIRKLAEGAKKLKDGTKQLDEKSVALQAGAGQVYDGLTQLNEKMPNLTEGAAKVEGGVRQLQQLAGSMLSEKQKLTTAVGTIKPQAEAVGADIEAAGSALKGVSSIDLGDLNVEGLDSTAQGKVNAAWDTKKAQIEAALLAQMGSIGTNIDKAGKDMNDLSKTLTSLAGGSSNASSGSEANTSEQLEALVNGAANLYKGTQDVADAVGKLQAGAGTLSDGTVLLKTNTKKLADGAQELYDGIMKVDDKMPEIIDGIEKLSDGTMELSDGLKKFRDEGLSKLNEIVDGDLGNIADRLSVTVDVAKSYNSFAGLSKDMKGSTTFVFLY